MDKILELCNRYKYQIILITVILLLSVSIGIILLVKQDKDIIEDNISEVSVVEKVEVEPIVDTKKIKVNIKGSVINPGVYELEEGSRVIDAIDISGGLLQNADTSILNLSKKLKDEDVVIIYNVNEVKKIKEGNIVIQYIEKECNCPDINNSACIDPDTVISDNINDEKQTSDSTKISINTATLEQLQTLTGIGKSKAEAIIEYRTTNGLFKTIEDIKNVSGIGEAAFEKIKENITT